jgi:hypothetical protein
MAMTQFPPLSTRAQTVWDSYLGIGFNLIFTCLPVVVCAVMDMDVPIKALDRYPRLYRYALTLCSPYTDGGAPAS